MHNTEADKKKRWLWRYREQREIFRSLSEQVTFWRGMGDTIAGPQGPGEPEPEDRWLAATLAAKECEVCFSDWCDQAACVCAEVWMAISKLPSNEALILTLRYIDGLPFTTIADRLGVAKSTVTKYHDLGLERLDIKNAMKNPPNLRYKSDSMFCYESVANIYEADTGIGRVYRGDPRESFFE